MKEPVDIYYCCECDAEYNENEAIPDYEFNELVCYRCPDCDTPLSKIN